MQDDYEPVIRSHRLKQLLARRSSNPSVNPSSNEPSEIFDSSRIVQQNLCDISTSHKVNSLNSSYRPLPNLPSSSPQATDRNYLTEELPKRKVEPNVFERQSDKENITTRNQTKAISKMLEKENNNTTDMNPVTASSIPTRPNVTSMMTFEDRESTRWETVDNRPVPGETTRRSSLGMIESNLSSYTTSRYPETANRDFDNKSQRSSLAKNLVQPNPSPRHFLRESEPNFMFSADRVSQRASDISGEFLASPAMSEEDLYKSSPFLMYSEVNRSPRLLMASERTGTHMLASQSQPQRVVEGIMCPEHHDSVITYICLQDKCGRLLCKSCAQEHRRKNHQGVYETLQNFKRNVNSQLIQAKASLVTNANQIAHLQFDMDKSGLVEKINKIEESLINGIRQYCENLRKEYSKDASLDSGKFSQNLTALHEGINGMVEKLDEDLQSLLACKDNSVLSAQFLSKMVMESYMSCSDEFKSAVAEVNNKVRLFMENQERTVQKSSDMVLQADSDVVLKLNEFLTKNIKLVKPQQTFSRDSISPRRTSKDVSKPKPDIPKSYETKRPSKEVIVNQKIAEPKQVYKSIAQQKVQQTKRASSVNPKTSRSFSLAHEAEPFEYEEEEQYQQQREQKMQKSITPKWKGKEDDKDLVSLLWEQQEGIEEQIHTFSARQNEVNSNGIDSYPMRLILKHMAKVYNSEKIKVMDDGFFEGLYDFPEFVGLADFRKRELCFDNVKQYMQIPSGRGRCLFSAYEKVFFLLNLDNKEWVLIEVRKSPKSIIIYDFLGKLSRTEIIQNIFDTMFKVIKFEYKTRLGQNVESHMWDRKIAGEPCLSFRDPNDTGILVLKMIANEYKSKPALQGSISPEEIGETRKMLEAIFAALEGNEQESYDAH